MLYAGLHHLKVRIQIERDFEWFEKNLSFSQKSSFSATAEIQRVSSRNCHTRDTDVVAHVTDYLRVAPFWLYDSFW
jgi:hypothetical protein